MIKKTALAVLALSSSMAMAGTMGCAPGSVTVPCEATAYDFGAEALYLKQHLDSDNAYLGLAQGTNTVTFRDFDSDWNWGFRLQGSYHWGTGTDATVSWIYYNPSNDHYSPFGLVGFNTDLNFHNETLLSQLSAEVGQTMNAGNMTYRVHGGFSWLYLKSDSTALFNIGNVSGSAISSAKTYGLGARLGLDGKYRLYQALSIYAKSAAALYAGQSKFELASFGNFFGRKTSMTPALEAKLGATYDLAMGNGNVTLDVGYMWINYFNALHTIPVPGFIRESDSMFHGLTVGGHWVGNVA